MKKIICVVIISFLMLTGCERNRTDRVQREQTENMVAEANRQVGMPGISNFTERKFAKLILELRDTKVATFTYTVDMEGRLHFLCNSIGYGLPYSVQFTNPEKRISRTTTTGTIPQPDPNGLFMPDGLSATWVLCDDGKGGVSAVYSEPALLVSPFKLNDTGDSYRE